MNSANKRTRLSVENLDKRYNGLNIFKDLSLQLEVGNFALLGENGIGKSTLLRICAGIETFDAGEIFVAGFNSSKQKIAANAFRSYVPDKPEFYEWATVSELLTLGCSIRKVQHRMTEIVSEWDLGDLLDRRFQQLSFGLKKRVFLAFNLLDSIPIWIMDEPFNGLDLKWQNRLAEKLQKNANQRLILASIHESHIVSSGGFSLIRLKREESSQNVQLQFLDQL